MHDKSNARLVVLCTAADSMGGFPSIEEGTMDNQRLMTTFFDLIAIESPSRHEARMADYCTHVLEDLGFDVTIDDSAPRTGSDTGNIIAFLPGTVPGHIAFSAHLDTVRPCEGIEPVVIREVVDGEEQEVIRSAGPTILSADDKSGITAIFEGIRSAIESGIDRPDISVILSTCEEISLVGASALSDHLFDGSVPCFVLDADGHPGSIIIGSPYHHSFQAVFKGRAAHAGVEPEAGASAIQMAADAISNMDLGRIDDVTTANVGVINGGVSDNVVPAECTLIGECRSIHPERVMAQVESMTDSMKQAAHRYHGQVDVHWTMDYPGLLYDVKDPLVQRLSHAAESIGITPRYLYSGGGADANILGTKGARAITLGTGMTNFHSTDEFITVRDLQTMARYIEAIIAEFSE